MWPAIIPALIVIKLVLPGTLGAIKQSFLPAGGLIAEQQSMPGASGSGRLADLGPALNEWKQKPLVGEGFGTRVIKSSLADDFGGTVELSYEPAGFVCTLTAPLENLPRLAVSL